MSALDRAAVIAAYRRALDILDASEALPMPYFSGGRIEFYLDRTNAVRDLAALESAFAEAGPLAGGVKGERPETWVATGELGGVTVEIWAPAELVAEKRVTGTTVTEIVEWVRLPVQDEAPEGGAEA